MTRYFSRLTVCVLVVLLSACGFHLRGLGDPGTARQFPFHSLYIDSSLPVASALAARLRYEPTMRLLPSATNADAVLRILSETRNKDISSIDRNGQTNEYRLTYSMTAQLYMDGSPVGPQIVVRQSRTMTYSSSVVLGKGQEEDLLWNDMVSDAAQLMLYRLSTNQMHKAAAAVAASAALGKAPDAGTRP
jgi:LPS-assembly lipoprotein